MTIWLWMFLFFFTGVLVPVSFSIGTAVGMEQTSWGRAVFFAAFEAFIAMVAMKLMPLDFFLLKAFAGIFAALVASPLLFRGLMTREMARALLGAFLMTVVGVGGAILLVVF